MKPGIEKYNAVRLREFIGSADFGSMPVIPVTRHRAESWLNNPRMDPADILMYTVSEGSGLIAYRCILPDKTGDTRFGWLSGNWVVPARRREGIATRLFEEAFGDWEGRLMYTNYAPESKAVYDDTGRFGLYASTTGMRYYLRSAAARLLPGRAGIPVAMKPILSLGDGIVNFWQDVRIRAAMGKNKADLLGAEPLEGMDRESHEFLAANHALGFGKRGMEEFGWIEAHPWIIEAAEKDKRYFFSSDAPVFRNHYIKIIDGAGEMTAFFMVARIDRRMTIPYASICKEKTASRILDHYLAKNGISVFTTYNPQVINEMKHSSLPLLGKRKMHRNYYATRELLEFLPDAGGIVFQDGEGDCVFT